MPSTNEAAERYIVERQLAAAEQKRGARVFDGDRERAVRKLADMEREGGLVRRAPATPMTPGGDDRRAREYDPEAAV